MGTVGRAIALVDFDYFFAQCEELRHPEYRGLPIAVCMLTGPETGAVASANYVARGFGVKSGMPVSKAKALAPNLVILPVDISYYSQISSAIMQSIRERYEKVEQASIDEAYIDLGEIDYDKAEDIGKEIKMIVKKAANIRCTVGIGPNKLIAKMACDRAKPDGLKVVRPDEVESFLESSRLDQIPYIGAKTAERLASMGVRTVSDARKLSVDDLIRVFGEKKGIMIYNFVRGIDERKVEVKKERKELEKFVSLKTRSPEEALEEAARKLFERLNGMLFQEVGVIAIFEDFTVRTKSRTLKHATSSFDELISNARSLLSAILNESEGKKIRRIAVKVSRFAKREGSLLDFI
ncbi:MAG: Y-family DNA polymerase [Nitrososphaeria archaeon]